MKKLLILALVLFATKLQAQKDTTKKAIDSQKRYIQAYDPDGGYWGNYLLYQSPHKVHKKNKIHKSKKTFIEGVDSFGNVFIGGSSAYKNIIGSGCNPLGKIRCDTTNGDSGTLIIIKDTLPKPIVDTIDTINQMHHTGGVTIAGYSFSLYQRGNEFQSYPFTQNHNEDNSVSLQNDTLSIKMDSKIKFIKIGDRVYKVESPTITEVIPQSKLPILNGSLHVPWGSYN